jgi:creatinine amidohydrolase
MLFAEMTRDAIGRVAPDAVAVLPTAAIEQHGPHMPTLTDTAACGEICRLASEAAEVPVVVTPVMWIGHSHHHFPHPGVLSLSTTTFVQVLRELGDSLVRSGFRRIAIVNGHGGNDELVRVAARDIANAHPVSVAAASYWTIAWREIAPLAVQAGHGGLPGHAGAFETSLVLALRPELVRTDAFPPALPARDVTPAQLQSPTVIRAGESLGSGPGYTDDPSLASAEAGRRYLDAIVPALARFLTDLHRAHPAV